MRFLLTAASWALLSLAGCDRGPAGPPLADVQGTVVYKKRPVAGALVVFTPEDGRRVAIGGTDADGRFRLATFEKNDGAVLGRHRVHIVANHPGREMTDEEKRESPDGSHFVPGPPSIPERFFRSDTSGLAEEVTAEGPNDFLFDLGN